MTATSNVVRLRFVIAIVMVMLLRMIESFVYSRLGHLSCAGSFVKVSSSVLSTSQSQSEKQIEHYYLFLEGSTHSTGLIIDFRLQYLGSSENIIVAALLLTKLTERWGKDLQSQWCSYPLLV
jgi:hypothetical protein